MKNRLDVAIGIASGAAQGTTIVHAQVVVLIAITMGRSPKELAWIASLGFLVPVVANGLTVFGDWISTRLVCLWAAGITLTGALLLTGAGFAIGRSDPRLTLMLVIVGSTMVPAALRHGDLVVAHLTLRERPTDQISQGQVLRTWLVVGIYLPALPAGLLVEMHGWPWVFAAYSVLNAAGLALMALKLKRAPRGPAAKLGPYLHHFMQQFADGKLVVAMVAAALVRALVFAWVTGVPVVLIARGHSPSTVGLIAAAGLLAAPLVLVGPARKRGDDVGLGLLAGAVPIGLALILAAATFLADADVLGSATVVVYLVLLAIGAGLAEAATQVGQLMTSYQATLAATEHNRFRRLGVANLGGNLGAMAGAAIGPLAAGFEERLWWFAIGGLALLYVVVQAAWVLLARRQGAVPPAAGQPAESATHEEEEAPVIDGTMPTNDELKAIVCANGCTPELTSEWVDRARRLRWFRQCIHCKSRM